MLGMMMNNEQSKSNIPGSIKIGDTFGDWEVIDDNIINYRVMCKCSCGKVKYVNVYTLKSGKSTGCGHNKNRDRVKDITGIKFGELLVLSYKGNQLWECQCSCGNITYKHRNNLLDGRATKCDNHLGYGEPDNLENERFGKLTARKYLGHKRWLCECDCGNSKIVLSQNLKNGSTKSCGCILYKPTKDELVSKILEYTRLNSRKPSIVDLSNYIGVSYKVIEYHLNKYSIADMNLLDSKFRSQGEVELYEFVKSNTNCIVLHNVNNIISPYELDIYIPDLRLAIEFNGTYWHSIKNKDKGYHKNKTMHCIDKNIRLIHIFEYEWNDANTRAKLEDILIGILKPASRKVYHARNLSISEVNKSDIYEFLNQNHLQNGIYSRINLGLYDENELIQIISFDKPRFINTEQFELIRVATKQGCVVTGGIERLFHYFVRKYNPDSIISYCNIAKFIGEVYNKLGFVFVKYTEPGYVWVDEHSSDVRSRYSVTKKQLVDNGLGTEDDTEDLIMDKLGYYKIYDSGNAVYRWMNK